MDRQHNLHRRSASCLIRWVPSSGSGQDNWWGANGVKRRRFPCVYIYFNNKYQNSPKLDTKGSSITLPFHRTICNTGRDFIKLYNIILAPLPRSHPFSGGLVNIKICKGFVVSRNGKIDLDVSSTPPLNSWTILACNITQIVYQQQ